MEVKVILDNQLVKLRVELVNNHGISSDDIRNWEGDGCYPLEDITTKSDVKPLLVAYGELYNGIIELEEIMEKVLIYDGFSVAVKAMQKLLE